MGPVEAQVAIRAELHLQQISGAVEDAASGGIIVDLETDVAEHISRDRVVVSQKRVAVQARPPAGAGQIQRAGELGQLRASRSEEHTSELQSQSNLVCRLLLEKKK